ncbi:MAG: 16S rRNA (cytosine(1402)-N(4))-methyltransferase RsmH, partial [bacterium]|nr:16S rRNA (cytosine(1402)-N(4))-methyltransferase RsmH [bacterium]
MIKNLKLEIKNLIVMHVPVLKDEVIQYLDPQPNQNFIDCTLGFAGHTATILQRNGPNGKVLGIEIDKDICELAKRKIAEFSIINYQFSNDRLMVVNDSYTNLKEIVEREKFQPVDGILLDLGMSSWDLEQSGRGFSFQKDEPLDMRYAVQSAKCKVQSLTAQEIINEWSEEKLVKIFSEYGQERFARNIAQKIIEVRRQQPIETTFQLIEVIRKSFPRSYK